MTCQRSMVISSSLRILFNFTLSKYGGYSIGLNVLNRVI
jgi:hypothetical protein